EHNKTARTHRDRYYPIRLHDGVSKTHGPHDIWIQFYFLLAAPYTSQAADTATISVIPILYAIISFCLFLPLTACIVP
ncbi:hypothetical protein MPER_11180, partial [Moniliophthora perniciosa FA553]